MSLQLDQIDQELLAKPAAVVATIGPDGCPQLSPVWFLLEDGVLRFTIAATTQKARNLALDDRCSMLLFHPDSDDYYVEVRGKALIVDDRDYRFADRLGAKYGTDIRSFDRPGDHRLMVSLVPTRINVIDLRG